MVSVHLVVATLGFPVWLRMAHWINFLFMGFLFRSGLQILGSYPRLYWNQGSRPGTEWITFTRKKIPTDRPWTTLEQEAHVPAWLGQPGGKHLGLGRSWHFFGIAFWLLNGIVYVILLFATDEWRRLIPTSWAIIPAAWHTFLTYITLHVPPASDFHPYDPLQQLAYAGVVFLLGPFLIITGAAHSPAVEARFPWYVRALGGRQSARSLHFLGLVAFLAFLVVHVTLVAVVNFGHNMGDMVLGQHTHDEGLAIVIGLAVVAAVLLTYAVTTWWSLQQPRKVQNTLTAILYPALKFLAVRSTSHQHYTPKDISPVLLVNGDSPVSAEYHHLAADHFADYHLHIGGMVRHPLDLSLVQLEAMWPQDQITLHNCIQGWSGVAAWKGVPMRWIMNQCEPLPEVKFAVFYSFSEDTVGKEFYEVLDLTIMQHAQTMLAYELNGAPLPVPHGAPLRLRAETQLGYKMVKWLRAIEFVAEYHTIRDGQGGSREDNRHFSPLAGI